MAKRIKTREINIVEESGAFHSFFKKLAGESKDYNYEGLSSLRRLLSNEKARMLHVIKTEKPSSLYELAKKLNRDFKSVSDDIRLLERFGIVQMQVEKTGKRERYGPTIISDKVIVSIRI